MMPIPLRTDAVDDSDTRVVSFSLSPESARDTRIARLIAAAASLPARARLQGFYDGMLSRSDATATFSDKLVVAYEQGRQKAAETRKRLAGRPWIEAVSERAGSSWAWQVYVEGIPTVGGKAGTETKAYDAVIDARIAIMERHTAAAQATSNVPRVLIAETGTLDARGEAANTATLQPELPQQQQRAAIRRRP